MNSYQIEYKDELPQRIEEKMKKDVIDFETQSGIDVNYQKFSLTLKLESEVIGVLSAFTAYSEIYVDDMWVDTIYRNKGYGKKLLLELENKFKNQGFNNINLCTSKFQAPEFYKKCGYTLEFIRENKQNPNLTKYFFVKFFENEKQTQGVLS